jgi:hypothetical protein
MLAGVASRASSSGDIEVPSMSVMSASRSPAWRMLRVACVHDVCSHRVCVCACLPQVQQLAEQLLRAEIAAVSPNATGADDADALHRDLPTKLVKMVQVQPQGPRSPAPSDLLRKPSVTRGAPAVPACCYRTAFGPTGTALPS